MAGEWSHRREALGDSPLAAVRRAGLDDVERGGLVLDDVGDGDLRAVRVAVEEVLVLQRHGLHLRRRPLPLGACAAGGRGG